MRWALVKEMLELAVMGAGVFVLVLVILGLSPAWLWD